MGKRLFGPAIKTPKFWSIYQVGWCRVAHCWFPLPWKLRPPLEVRVA